MWQRFFILSSFIIILALTGCASSSKTRLAQYSEQELFQDAGRRQDHEAP